jgi:hypothetical protein
MPLSITIKQGDNKNKFVVGMFSRTVPYVNRKKDKRHTENRKDHAIYLRLAISIMFSFHFFDIIYSYIFPIEIK